MVPNEAKNEANNTLNNTLTQAQLQAQIQEQMQAHPILLAHDRNRSIRDYASPILYDFSPGIMCPTFHGSRFEMKLVMLQMLQTVGQFGGAPDEDPLAHLKSFTKICNTFVISNISPEETRLTLFPFSLRDEVRQWAYSLESGEITTWS